MLIFGVATPPPDTWTRLTEGWTDFQDAWELFFRVPTLTGTLAGALLGMLGVYIVLRRMVFLSAAVSQASGLGVAWAFYVDAVWGAATLGGRPPDGADPVTDPSWWVVWSSKPLWTATAFALIATLALAWRRRQHGRSEQLLGVVYLLGAAAVPVLLGRVGAEVHHVVDLVFGNPVVVLQEDYDLLVELCVGIGLVHAIAGRGFVQASFDPEGARVRGLPVAVLDLALLTSLALAVSFCTRVLGALPVFAFSVLPAIAAVRVTRSVTGALVLATALGAAAGYFGYFLAFVYSVPVGAVQTLLALAFVVVAVVVRQGFEGGVWLRARLWNRDS